MVRKGSESVITAADNSATLAEVNRSGRCPLPQSCHQARLLGWPRAPQRQLNATPGQYHRSEMPVKVFAAPHGSPLSPGHACAFDERDRLSDVDALNDALPIVADNEIAVGIDQRILDPTEIEPLTDHRETIRIWQGTPATGCAPSRRSRKL